MDVGNNMLVTCGMTFSTRMQQMTTDQFIKVFDLRYGKASQPIHVRRSTLIRWAFYVALAALYHRPVPLPSIDVAVRICIDLDMHRFDCTQ